MVDKTLSEKIRKYNKLSAEITELEKTKKELAAAIMAEYDARKIDRFGDMKIISTSRESINKKNCPAAIWERFKTISEYRYLKRCKA